MANKQTYLLDYATSIHLVGEFQNVALHLANKDLLLSLVTMLEELLNDVVAKHVLHQLECVLLELSENALFDLAVCRFELLLDKARAVLVSSEFNHVALDVGQFPSLALLLLPLEVC